MYKDIQFGDTVYYPEETYIENENGVEYIKFTTKCGKWNEYLFNTVYHPMVFKEKEIVDKFVELFNKYNYRKEKQNK